MKPASCDAPVVAGLPKDNLPAGRSASVLLAIEVNGTPKPQSFLLCSRPGYHNSHDTEPSLLITLTFNT